MKRLMIILGIIALSSTVSAQSFTRFKWEPRLHVGFGMGVYSPGGDDRFLYETSMGWGGTVYFWPKPRTQIVFSAHYSDMDAPEDEWYVRLEDQIPEGETFDVWDVSSHLWQLSLGLRALYPANNRNFLYLGFGGDMFIFDTIKGSYEIYQVGQPLKDVINDERSPSLTGGIHFAPGMFFLFKSFLGEMMIDVGVKLHYIMDGDDENPLWVDPHFSMGLKIF